MVLARKIINEIKLGDNILEDNTIFVKSFSFRLELFNAVRFDPESFSLSLG